MDYNYNQYEQPVQSEPRPDSGRQAMAIASLILGIASILTCCCTFFVTIPLASLSIIFAVLSRRKGEHMPGMSLAGILTSVTGIILGFFMVFYLIFYTIANWNDPAFRSGFEAGFEQSSGMDFDEAMEEFMEYYDIHID